MSVEPMNKLFTPIQVGGMQLRHRVVHAHAPLTRFRVDPGTNVIFPFVKEYYAPRASTPGTFTISEGM
jgi:NADPH2 dehydrogenase